MPSGSDKKLLKTKINDASVLFADITGAGAANPTVNATAGISNVTRTSVGLYRFLFSKPYKQYVKGVPTLMLNATTALAVVEARPPVAATSAALGYQEFAVRLSSAGTLTDLGATDRMTVEFTLADSALAATRQG